MKTIPSPEMLERFETFFELHSPGELSKALRRTLIEYIHRHLRTGFHVDFGQLLLALNDLMDLLDKVAKEKDVQERLMATREAQGKKE